MNKLFANLMLLLMFFSMANCQTTTKIETKLFAEWRSEPFSSRGQLAQRWEIDTPKNYEYSKIMATPNSWLIEDIVATESIQQKPIIERRISITPENGEIKPLPNIFTPGDKEFHMNLACLGTTDSTYVYASDSFMLGGIGSCWDLLNNKIIWSNYIVDGFANKFTIVGNGLIYVHENPSDESKIFSRLVPATGDILWSTKLTNEKIDWLSLNESIWVLPLNGTELLRVNLKDGSKTSINLIGIVDKLLGTIGHKIFLLTRSGNLILLDTIKMEQLELTIPDFHVDESSSVLFNKYLFAMRGNGKSNQYEIVSFDQIKQTFKKAQVFNLPSEISVSALNSSLIIEDQKQLRGVDPETLETLWWIDKKDLGENAHVAWLDWRGVCVVSDTKIMCFGSK